jgi:uncharacterized protein
MNTTTATSTQANVATVHAMYNAFGRGDIPAILGHLADDIVWDADTPSWGLAIYEPRHGRDAIPGFFQSLGTTMNLFKFEPTNFLVGGNQVACVVHYGAEMNGRRLEDIEVHLWTFGNDGKATRFAHIVDRHGLVSFARGVEP